MLPYYFAFIGLLRWESEAQTSILTLMSMLRDGSNVDVDVVDDVNIDGSEVDVDVAKVDNEVSAPDRHPPDYYFD